MWANRGVESVMYEQEVVNHMEFNKPYNFDEIVRALGRVLGVKISASAWDRVRNFFQSTRRYHVRSLSTNSTFGTVEFRKMPFVTGVSVETHFKGTSRVHWTVVCPSLDVGAACGFGHHLERFLEVPVP